MLQIALLASMALTAWGLLEVIGSKNIPAVRVLSSIVEATVLVTLVGAYGRIYG